MSALDTNGIANVCAAIDAGDGAVMLYDAEMRDVIDALDDRERAIGRERTRADAAEAEVARLRAIVEGRTTAPTRAILPVYVNPGCHSDDDGDCVWSECPQLRDGEPKATGRHCPRDMRGDE